MASAEPAELAELVKLVIPSTTVSRCLGTDCAEFGKEGGWESGARTLGIEEACEGVEG